MVAAKIRELADRVARDVIDPRSKPRGRGYSFMQDWDTMKAQEREQFLKRYTDQSDYLMDQLDILLGANTGFRDSADLFRSMVRDGYIPTVNDAELLKVFVQTRIPYFSGSKPYQAPKGFIRQREKAKAKQPKYDLMRQIGPATTSKEIDQMAVAAAKRGHRVLLGIPAFELYSEGDMWVVLQPHKRNPNYFRSVEKAAKFMREEWFKGGHIEGPGGGPVRAAVRRALQGNA